MSTGFSSSPPKSPNLLSTIHSTSHIYKNYTKIPIRSSEKEDLEKSSSALPSKLNHRKIELNLATLNVNRADIADIRLSLSRYRWDIVGLTETKLLNENNIGNDIITSGVFSDNTKYYRGVALLMSQRAKQSLKGVIRTSERVLAARFKGSPFNLLVIVAYAPQKDASQELKEQFSIDLEKTISSKKFNEKLFILGDFNCSVGEGNQSYEDCMGPYGHGEMNDRGKLFLELIRRNNLFISNTIFKVHQRHRYTWENHNHNFKENRKQLDYVLIPQDMKKAVVFSRAYPGALQSSDHCMVITTIKSQRIIRDRKISNQKRLNLEKALDEDTQKTYQSKLTENLLPLDAKKQRNRS